MKINPTAALPWTPSPPRPRKSKPTATFWAFFLPIAFACAGARLAPAQEVPRIQFFGGYSYTRFDTSTFGFAGASNLNGWNAAVAYNLTRNIGGIAELTSQYGTHVNLRDFAAGPQFLFPHGNMVFFAHALFGKGRTFVNQGFGAGDTQPAYLVGGGIDRPFLRHFDIRLVQVDYVHTHLLEQQQNNLRISTGLVYRWGEVHRTKHRAPTTQTP